MKYSISMLNSTILKFDTLDEFIERLKEEAIKQESSGTEWFDIDITSQENAKQQDKELCDKVFILHTSYPIHEKENQVRDKYIIYLRTKKEKFDILSKLIDLYSWTEDYANNDLLFDYDDSMEIKIYLDWNCKTMISMEDLRKLVDGYVVFMESTDNDNSSVISEEFKKFIINRRKNHGNS